MIDALAVSVAVMVWLPKVFSVAKKVPVPFVRVEFAGSAACGSVLVKWIVPEYVGATLFAASRALT